MMDKSKQISALFWLAAGYDGILGIAFLLCPSAIFQTFNVPPPNHFAYVQFPAALLIVFAFMFIAVARRPLSNRNLIPYGIALKVSYCSIAFYYWFTSDVPDMWKPFAVIDVLFGILFCGAFRRLGGTDR